LLARLAHELHWSDRREHAISLCQRAIEVAREVGNTRALLSALWTEHELYWGPENIDKRLATASEIGRLALESGYTRWILRAHEMRLSAMLELGDIAAADAEIEASEELKTRSGHAFATVERFRVTRSLMRGEFGQAETRINELMRQAQRRQDVALITSFGSLLLMLRGEQGRLDEVEGPLKGSVARFPAMTAARCSLALFYVRTGRESEARAELEVLARDGFARISRDWNWLGSLAICAEVCSTLGDVPRATTLYKLLSGFANRNVTIGWGDICYGSVSRYLGLLASTTRRFDDAERHFEDAIRFELKMVAEPFAARTRVCYAAMLIERGAGADHERARTFLDTAIDIATKLKMAGLARQAASIAARLTRADAPVAAAAGLERGFAVGAAAAQRRLATIMFLDIVDSTGRAARMGDSHWSGIIEQYYSLVREELRKFCGREINTFGDDFFALFEAPAPAVRCACAIRSAMGEIGLQVRAGLHTGECEVSGDKVAGIAVHIGARVVRKAAPGEVIVSATVKDLVVGAGFEFTDRGLHELRGIPGEWHLFAAN
jgi:class 3 adenylate cyclase